MKRAFSIRLAIAIMAFCLPLIPNPATAQQEKDKEPATTEHKPVAAYHIELNVREIEEGKRLNSRNYLMVVKDDDWAKMRVGNKVSYLYSSSSQQYSYTDVGMSVDCRPYDLGDSIGLSIRVEFSGLAPAPQTASAPGPVFRTDRADIESIVTPGKPTLVGSMDDVLSNRRYEIEVTAMKVK